MSHFESFRFNMIVSYSNQLRRYYRHCLTSRDFRGSIRLVDFGRRHVGKNANVSHHHLLHRRQRGKLFDESSDVFYNHYRIALSRFGLSIPFFAGSRPEFLEYLQAKGEKFYDALKNVFNNANLRHCDLQQMV
jgi:hypothetical protein